MWGEMGVNDCGFRGRESMPMDPIFSMRSMRIHLIDLHRNIEIIAYVYSYAIEKIMSILAYAGGERALSPCPPLHVPQSSVLLQ